MDHWFIWGHSPINHNGECDFVIGDEAHVGRLVQVTWEMRGDDPEKCATRRREVNGLLDAAEALHCEDITIVTHDEDYTITERGHTVKIVPAWKFLLGM